MRWETVALALLGQALQAGVKYRPHSWLYTEKISQPIEIISEPSCQCLCVCDQPNKLTLATVLGLISGFAAFGACSCSRRSSQGEPSPSHRRRGHGVISEPSAWANLGRLLR